MFTGIIRQLGSIASLEQQPEAAIIMVTTKLAPKVREGDSIAVNGACLTVLEATTNQIMFRLMRETLNKTNLGNLQEKDIVNLERPVAAGERFDGHFVLGHVDGVATIINIDAIGDDRIFSFTPSANFMPLLIKKGSVALDGVSLTVVDIHPANSLRSKDIFTVSLMPYTLDHTTFGFRKVGQQVNLEIDMIAKHVERIMENR
jgi:riboflavin synthase